MFRTFLYSILVALPLIGGTLFAFLALRLSYGQSALSSIVSLSGSAEESVLLGVTVFLGGLLAVEFGRLIYDKLEGEMAGDLGFSITFSLGLLIITIVSTSLNLIYPSMFSLFVLVTATAFMTLTAKIVVLPFRPHRNALQEGKEMLEKAKALVQEIFEESHK